MPPPETSPKRVLITGAAKRIGRSLALDFADNGWDVAIHYNTSGDAAAEVVDQIKSRGAAATSIACDLSNTDEAVTLLDRAAEALGPITCLINNASEFRFDSVTDLTPEGWDLHLDINLKTPVFLAQALARNLPPGAQGNVINIIDQRVWNLTPEFFSYTVSKAGLWSATRMLAQALAPNIRVNAIGPGPVLKSIHQTDADFAQEVETTLLKRGSSPEEIAAAVRFILDCPAMTGQMLALDGGQHLTWSNAPQTVAVPPGAEPTQP